MSSIDKSGKYVINPLFDEASEFEDGLTMVKVGSKWGYIDKAGKYAINPQFEDALDFEDGLATGQPPRDESCSLE